MYYIVFLLILLNCQILILYYTVSVIEYFLKNNYSIVIMCIPNYR